MSIAGEGWGPFRLANVLHLLFRNLEFQKANARVVGGMAKGELKKGTLIPGPYTMCGKVPLLFEGRHPPSFIVDQWAHTQKKTLL